MYQLSIYCFYLLNCYAFRYKKLSYPYGIFYTWRGFVKSMNTKLEGKPKLNDENAIYNTRYPLGLLSGPLIYPRLICI